MGQQQTFLGDGEGKLSLILTECGPINPKTHTEHMI